MTLPGNHPFGPQVDHIIPVSKGGAEFDEDNCQLVHARCNASKREGRQPKVIKSRYGSDEYPQKIFPYETRWMRYFHRHNVYLPYCGYFMSDDDFLVTFGADDIIKIEQPKPDWA